MSAGRARLHHLLRHLKGRLACGVAQRHVGTGRQQGVHAITVGEASGVVQGGVADAVLHVDVAPTVLHEELDDVGVAPERGEVHRGALRGGVGRVGVGALGLKLLHLLDGAVHGVVAEEVVVGALGAGEVGADGGAVVGQQLGEGSTELLDIQGCQGGSLLL